MSLINYTKYKISIDPKSKKIQGLQAGDIVRRQYFDGKNTIYSLMAVLDTGIDKIANENGVLEDSPYFVGALLDGDIPSSDQVLDFARMTNLFNADRSGALYLTASDSEAPYMSVLDKLGTEKSLCIPFLPGNTPSIASKDKYHAILNSNGTYSYQKYLDGAYRVFSINKTSSGNARIKTTFEDTLMIQNVVIISYKIKATRSIASLPFKFGYTDDSKYEAEGTVSVSTAWEYKFHLVRIDQTPRDTRSFTIVLDNAPNSTISVAELNIIKLSDIANFTNANKATIGKIGQIVDPVFGTLKGYGVYSQNLYATQNVGIAGTLTAGDENGFSSTFYAGRIQKNLIRNSLECDFQGTATLLTNENLPARIGNAYKFTTVNMHTLVCRETGWASANKDKIATFSIWIKGTKDLTVKIYQNTNLIDSFEIEAGWRRYTTTFPVYSTANELTMRFETTEQLIVCSPQLEFGEYATQYQPTDGTLSEDSESYGFWACKGGIGGTIQNPLLRLEEDGSIRARGNKFYILKDGSAYFKGQVEIGDGSTLGGNTLIKNGTINTDVLNVREIFAKDISTNTIVGALLTFNKGTIGGWEITTDKITSETTSGKDHIELSTAGGIKAIVANQAAWSLNPNGSGSLANGKITWTKDNKGDWNLSVDGKITATSGKIGKWNIDTDSIYIGTKQSSDNYTTSGITIYSDGTNGAIRSKNFRIDTDGGAYFKGSGEFGGKITATSGAIAGWNITSSVISKNNISLGSDGSITNGTKWKLNNDGSGTLANGGIFWTSAGILSVSRITATSGTIGAWTIDADSLYSGAKQTAEDYSTSGITLSSKGAIRAKEFRINTDGTAYFKGTLNGANGIFSGSLNAASGTFVGKLSSATGSFSGKITANEGSIGGWNINNNSISNNDIYLGSNGDIYCSYGNAEYWKIDNMGSASFAQGKIKFNKDGSGGIAEKITWDKDGKMTIDNSVKVNATVTAEQINSLKLTLEELNAGAWNFASDGRFVGQSFGGSYISLNPTDMEILLVDRLFTKIQLRGTGDSFLANGNIRFNSQGAGSIGDKITWDSDGVVTLPSSTWNGGTITNGISINKNGAAVLNLSGSNTEWQAAQIKLTNQSAFGYKYQWTIEMGGSKDGDGGLLFESSNPSGEGSAQSSPWYRVKFFPHGDSTAAIGASGPISNTSDIRLKTRFDNVTSILDKIQNIDAFYYTWKNNEDKILQIGVSAQDVKESFPQLVYILGDTEVDRTLGVDYATLATTVAINGCKELLQRIENLENKLREAGIN